jgi:hypothetical protein
LTRIIGVVAAIVAGIALATGTVFAVTTAANPDRSIDIQHAKAPDNTAYGVR